MTIIGLAFKRIRKVVLEDTDYTVSELEDLMLIANTLELREEANALKGMIETYTEGEDPDIPPPSEEEEEEESDPEDNPEDPEDPANPLTN